MIKWSRSELAKEAGVSPGTIYNLEKGERSFSSAQKVRITFESKGFEFIGTQGVSRAENTFVTYSGQDGCHKFYEDLMATAKNYGGETAVIHTSSQLLLRSLGIVDSTKLDRLNRLRELTTVKCLLSDTQDASCLISLLEVKAIPQPPLGHMGAFVCGNSFTVIIPIEDGFTFHVRKAVDIANKEMLNFTRHWNTAVPLVIQSTPQA